MKDLEIWKIYTLDFESNGLHFHSDYSLVDKDNILSIRW